MNNFNKAIKLIKKDRCLLGKKIILRFFKWLPDSIYLRILYRFAMGHRLNLKNPQTFTEKIQWLKLYDRKPEYTTMVDKYAVKEYVAERIGKKYVIPTLGVWDKPEQIDFDLLPGKFVLKTTHGGGGGGVIVCPDKSKLDIKATRIKLTAALKANIYRNYREWPYKNVPRRIIAEKFIEIPEKKNLTDYKVYCFNGLPRYIQVIQDRNTMETIDFFDTEWNHQEFYGLNPIPKPANAAIPKPANLQEMLQISKKLAKGTDFVRVDVYQVKDGIYFGELTFYPASGLGTFTPKEWNQKLGDLLRLNKKEKSSGMGIAEGGGKYLIYNNMSIVRRIENQIKDYKFFCFEGEPKFLKVDFDRFIDHHANYYDMDWNLLPFGEAELPPDEKRIEVCPPNFDEMIDVARKLSYGHKFLRVDLYNVEGEVYFGELTFYPASGLERWTDKEIDLKLGNLICME